MKVNAPGVHGPAGHVLHAGSDEGYRLFLAAFHLDGSGKLLGEFAAPQAVPLGVHIQHPDVAHALAPQGPVTDTIGGYLRHHFALEHLLDVGTIVRKVILGIYGHLVRTVEYGVEIVIGLCFLFRLHNGPLLCCSYPISMRQEDKYAKKAPTGDSPAGAFSRMFCFIPLRSSGSHRSCVRSSLQSLCVFR